MSATLLERHLRWECEDLDSFDTDDFELYDPNDDDEDMAGPFSDPSNGSSAQIKCPVCLKARKNMSAWRCYGCRTMLFRWRQRLASSGLRVLPHCYHTLDNCLFDCQGSCVLSILVNGVTYYERQTHPDDLTRPPFSHPYPEFQDYQDHWEDKFDASGPLNPASQSNTASYTPEVLAVHLPQIVSPQESPAPAKPVCATLHSLLTHAAHTHRKVKALIKKVEDLRKLPDQQRKELALDKKIDRKDRAVVCRALVNHLHSTAPPSTGHLWSYADIHVWADKCSQYFFEEDQHLWFHVSKGSLEPGATPGQSRNKKSRAQGPLWEAYNNYRKDWRARHPKQQQLLTAAKNKKSKKRKAAKRVTSRTSQSLIDSSHLLDDAGEGHPEKKKRGRPRKICQSEEEKAEQLESLLNDLKASSHYQTLSEWRDHSKINQNILSAWRATAPLRFNLINHSTDVIVPHYLPLFPQLASPITGPKLVASDFNFLFPDIAEDALTVGLRRCASVIIQSAKRCLKSRYHRDIPTLISALSCYANNKTDEHSRLQLLLVLLCFAIPAAGKRLKPDTLHKRQVVSKQDSQISFIAFFETPEQKDAHHQELIVANSGFVQPYIAVLGSVTDIQQVFVRVNDFEYMTDNLLTAVELCFKMFYTFNLKYTLECEHIWFVIQELFYKIPRTSKDHYISAAYAFITGVKDSIQADEEAVAVALRNPGVVGPSREQYQSIPASILQETAISDDFEVVVEQGEIDESRFLKHKGGFAKGLESLGEFTPGLYIPYDDRLVEVEQQVSPVVEGSQAVKCEEEESSYE
ncbi:hypothetical protein GE061_003362 [Apolygus lucorum]|uniref:Uncharacterized protein n=1 Tax=Apolygus lucorum TaxID=248454 RepID=A0A8S9X5X2_APOLU|nr:hypothetical protein GE061_003362 [Apolygus lucorum]